MREAAHTSETSVNNYFTWQYIPEDNSELYTRRHENLKSQEVDILRCDAAWTQINTIVSHLPVHVALQPRRTSTSSLM
jgi:hypothetical protein